MFSPDKIISLHKSFLTKSGQLSWYAMQAVAGKEMEPLVMPSPADRRFKSDAWQKWPFNAIYQGFLLYQDWWQEATSDIRGVMPHHLDVISFTARQWLDMVSPSNSPLTNPDVVATTRQEGGANFWQGYRHNQRQGGFPQPVD